MKESSDRSVAAREAVTGPPDTRPPGVNATWRRLAALCFSSRAGASSVDASKARDEMLLWYCPHRMIRSVEPR